MTAMQLAEMLAARPAGRSRWQAKCPSHKDRRPSLSITQGKNCVLLKCWSNGCTVEQIVTALGIHVRDLFNGALAPEELRLAAQAKARHDAHETRQRAADRVGREHVFRLGQLVDAIGAKLARSPLHREMGRLFHAVCQKWQTAETEIYPIPPELGGLRMQGSPAIPPDVSAALYEIGQSFGEVQRPSDVGIERTA